MGMGESDLYPFGKSCRILAFPVFISLNEYFFLLLQKNTSCTVLKENP